jgi:hypothetical protein
MNMGKSGLKERPVRERFSEIEGLSISQRSLEERLKEYPELKATIEAMLSIIENAPPLRENLFSYFDFPQPRVRVEFFYAGDSLQPSRQLIEEWDFQLLWLEHP